MVTDLIPATGEPLHDLSQKPRGALVTGGRGFIGRAVGKLLQREGYPVISADRAGIEISSENQHREIVCDITDAVQLRRVFESKQIDGIVHLAAILPTAAQRDPVLATQVNIQGSINLLEMAWQFGVRRFVFGSSLSMYGTCAADRVVSELDRAAPEDLYGLAKLYIEQFGEIFGNVRGLEFVSLRIGRVVGPGAKSVTSAWRSQIFEFLETREPREIAMPYMPEERVLLLHVDDVARMLVTLLQAPRITHLIYNAPCESFAVADLKRCVEELNANIIVKTGDAWATGNPRLLDSSRFRNEFNFKSAPIADRLRDAARK
jgi:nucleoside-diphosphate-sugar epimerase